MIKEALEYLIGLSKDDVVDVGGKTFSIPKLNPVLESVPAPLMVSTLTSVVEYIKSNVDNRNFPFVVHVCNPTMVIVKSSLYGAFEQRDHYVEADASTPDFRFGSWYDHESFIIALQSKFQPSDHLKGVLSLVGNIKDSGVKTYGDDGVTQTVQAKAGIAKVEDVAVPNPVTLVPFRTFVEVEQPASKFVFRMRSGREMPEMALFEADGGAWKNEAMRNIRDYLGTEMAPSVERGEIVLIS